MNEEAVTPEPKWADGTSPLITWMINPFVVTLTVDVSRGTQLSLVIQASK